MYDSDQKERYSRSKQEEPGGALGQVQFDARKEESSKEAFNRFLSMGTLLKITKNDKKKTTTEAYSEEVYTDQKETREVKKQKLEFFVKKGDQQRPDGCSQLVEDWETGFPAETRCGTRAIALMSVMSKWYASCVMLPMEKEKEPEICTLFHME